MTPIKKDKGRRGSKGKEKIVEKMKELTVEEGKEEEENVLNISMGTESESVGE